MTPSMILEPTLKVSDYERGCAVPTGATLEGHATFRATGTSLLYSIAPRLIKWTLQVSYQCKDEWRVSARLPSNTHYFRADETAPMKAVRVEIIMRWSRAVC